MIEGTSTSVQENAPQTTEALEDAQLASRAPQNYWSYVKRQYKKNFMARLALWFVYLLIFLGVFADFLANDRPIICSYKDEIYAPIIHDYMMGLGLASAYTGELSAPDWKSLDYDWKISPPVPYNGNGTDILSSFVPPFEGDHILGADQLGRDVLAGMIHGSRVSLSIGIVSMGIAAIIGVLLGAMAGYFGGWVDLSISRLIELFLNFPTFFLIITIVSFLDANIMYVMIIIGLTGWMGIARLVRGEVLRVRNMEYITAAKSLGFDARRVITRHVLPNSLAPVLVSIAFGIAGAILTESALSFLGLGVPATQVTWGSALTQARTNNSAWWLAVFPGFMIFLTVLSYNLIGDGLRDATDPRLKQ